MGTKITIVVIALVAMMSCSKDPANNPNQGYWVLGRDHQNIISTTRSDNNGYFILSGINSHSNSDTLQIYFSSMPVSSAKYTVVAFRSSPPLASDEMGFKLSTYSVGAYYSTGIANMLTWPWPAADKADLTVTNGKIMIVIPRMTTYGITSTSIDSFYLEGKIFEK